jgi:hypothetical protein
VTPANEANYNTKSALKEARDERLESLKERNAAKKKSEAETDDDEDDDEEDEAPKAKKKSKR